MVAALTAPAAPASSSRRVSRLVEDVLACGTPTLSAPAVSRETVNDVQTDGSSGNQDAKGGDNLVSFGKPLLLLLRKDQRAVGRHVELTAGADDDVGVDAESLLDGGRQTGGPGQVVSNFAVAD